MFINLPTILILCVILRLVKSETTKEPLKTMPQRSTLRSNSDYVSTDTWEGNPNLNSMWVYRPPPHVSSESQGDQQNNFHRVSLRAPLGVARLAKPLTYGFDPYFNKEYFGPFETRQKPVTLVAFRRNGLQPKSFKTDVSKSAEVAELQSPFNEISNLWQDEPGLFNE